MAGPRDGPLHAIARLRIAARSADWLISARDRYFAPIASATDFAGPPEKIPRVRFIFSVDSIAVRSAAGPWIIRSVSTTSDVTRIPRRIFAILTASTSGSPPTHATFA